MIIKVAAVCYSLTLYEKINYGLENTNHTVFVFVSGLSIVSLCNCTGEGDLLSLIINSHHVCQLEL